MRAQPVHSGCLQATTPLVEAGVGVAADMAVSSCTKFMVDLQICVVISMTKQSTVCRYTIDFYKNLFPLLQWQETVHRLDAAIIVPRRQWGPCASVQQDI